VHPRKGQRPKFSTNRGVAADHDAPPTSSRNLLPNCAIGSLNPPSPPLHYIMADEPATQPRLASPPSTHEITHPPIGKGSRGAIRDYTRLPTARPQSSARIPAQSRRGATTHEQWSGEEEGSSRRKSTSSSSAEFLSSSSIQAHMGFLSGSQLGRPTC
jgi:hypothetical protein